MSEVFFEKCDVFLPRQGKSLTQAKLFAVDINLVGIMVTGRAPQGRHMRNTEFYP